MPPVTLPCIDSIIDLIKVALILKNPELFEEWKVDIWMMAGRIIDMRRQLHHLLTNKPKTPGNCMHTLHDAVRPAMPSLPQALALVSFTSISHCLGPFLCWTPTCRLALRYNTLNCLQFGH